MRESTVLLVISIVQVVFCALLVGVLMMHRRRTVRTTRARARYVERLVEPLRSWALGERPVESLLPVLRAVPSAIALEAISVHCAVRASPTEHARMAAAFREERWVQQVLDQHRSAKWTERLMAARMLVIAGVPGDRPMLQHLLQDPHAAVVSAALSGVRFLGDVPMVESLLTALPHRPEFLRARTLES